MRDMAGNLCRLCFKTKTWPIGIFTAKGIKLNIAELIRMHFSDEVAENDDLLPQFVCLLAKLAKFHEFFNAVNDAKNEYLTTFVKNEEPKFIEVANDPFGPDDDIPALKPEPIVAVIGEVESVSHNDEDDNDRDANNALRSHYNSGEKFYRAKPMATIPTVPKLENEIDANAKHTSSEKSEEIKRSTEPSDQLELLIMNYIDMKCEICEQPFETLKDARQHMRIEHKRQTITVNCCQKKVDLYHINGHIQSHLDPETFKCDYCGKRFQDKRKLKMHQKYHLPKTFECDICKKGFFTLTSVKDHILSSHAKPQHKCESCKKSFTWKRSLDLHLQIVHEQRERRVCHICAKVYNTTKGFLRHMQAHENVNEPRADCQLCGKTYKRKNLMLSHIKRVHGKETQSFPCPTCHKISRTEYSLAKHIKSVHNYKAHKCHLCDGEFKTATALKEHVATHTGSFLYNCAYCSKKFKHNTVLYWHYNKYHQAEWSVDKYNTTRTVFLANSSPNSI